MMEPRDFQQAWRLILDSLLCQKQAAEKDYYTRGFASLQEQLDFKDRLRRATDIYEAALDACLEGQDPVIWKLSYSG